jgi:hypothetical protein
MLAIVLATIASLFAIYLLAKARLGWKVCVLCAAVVTTWFALLILYRLGRFHDPVLVALLLGQSITGSFYFVQRRVVASLKIFTLPFFLSLTAASYFLIAGLRGSLPVMLLLMALWLAAYVAFSYRNDPGKKPVVNAVVDCCKEA